MSNESKAWQGEINRRAQIYDDLDAGSSWQGRMTSSDYLSVIVLTLVLVAGFWVWGH